MCHGPAGAGTVNGPSLRAAGTASVDFMLRTGRMPLKSPRAKLQRHEPRFDEAEIDAIVAYAASFTRGPAVPTLDLSKAELPSGNRVFREQCAACHQAAGAGGALAYGDAAPSLRHSSPVEVAEAVRTGPGQMPAFTATNLDDTQLADVAAYVRYLQHPSDRGGINLGHLGPVPEGFIAWVVGLGALLVVARRLGGLARSPKHER